ncbi:MAG: hypothetical protein K2G89_10080 [Lachnospiraceae bacterium]|nr:hypothetical protein [Lachnospiraceae bacterium]
MRRLKKYICYGMIMSMLISLTGCGGEKAATDTQEVYVPVTYASMEAELLDKMAREKEERDALLEGQEKAEEHTDFNTGQGQPDSTSQAGDGVNTAVDGTQAAGELPVMGTITFWYTDDRDIEYLRAASEEFERRYNIHVDYILKNEADFLEAVNQAALTGMNQDGPDAYMLSNDLIKKARLSGLVEKNTWYDEQFWSENYPVVAKNALSSGVGVYGYPVYLDTFFMLYDQDFAGEPITIENVLEFSENFVDEENKKEIFRWDISDPFYNFMFLGGYASLLGATGEDASLYDVTNEYVVESMEYFQSIHEILSMDMEDSSYAKIKKKVKKNKLIYAICKTDILPVLEETENSYKLAKLPKLTDTLNSGSLSITYAACVNPYSDSISAATLFSIFLSYEFSGEQFGLNRKISTRSSITRSDENDILIFDQYILSDTIPKALQMGDFWTYSEVAFSNIWHGADVKEELSNLQETIRSRLE